MKKKHKRKNQVRITENEIKNKLYGQEKEIIPEQTAGQSKITEEEIMKKLYPSGKKSGPVRELEEKTGDLFDNKDRTQPGIQEELDRLKQSISNLEEKLEASINQKERLKVKLVQKRKLINIREKLADLVLNRMPEKFIMLLIIVLIFAIFMIMKSLKPAPVRISEEVSQIQMKADTPDSKLAQTEPHLIPESSHPLTVTGKKYTIQAAEYADEQAAERFINALKKQGYAVNVDTIYRDKEKKKAYFKINVGAYNTLSDAKKFNEVFRKRTNIKDSFIKELKR